MVKAKHTGQFKLIWFRDALYRSWSKEERLKFDEMMRNSGLPTAPEQERIRRKRCAEEFNKTGDLRDVVMGVNRGEANWALMVIGRDADDSNYFRALALAWQGANNCHQDRDYFEHLFRIGKPNVNRRSMMDGDELAVFDSLPDQVKVYRGCGPLNRSGWSWTLNRARAEWFACEHMRARDGYRGLVLTGTCDRSEVLAYLSTEEEIIVPFGAVHIIAEERVEQKDSSGPA